MSFSQSLLRSIRSYAGQNLTRIAKSLAPKHLQAGISTSVRENAPGSITITITAKGADAHAQEYGSGLRSQYGKKAKYPIRPKTKKMLAFPWEVATANPTKFSMLPDGRVLLLKVMHPGINRYKGRGYIRPAVRQFTKRLKEDPKIKQEIKQAILGDIHKAFQTGAVKK